MCTICGCSANEADEVSSKQQNNKEGSGQAEHVHAHPHSHEPIHSHEHLHSHEPIHSHEHLHSHEHPHSHEHTHSHEHPHSHEHKHSHEHPHSHEHTNSHEHHHHGHDHVHHHHEHSHPHQHSHSNGHHHQHPVTVIEHHYHGPTHIHYHVNEQDRVAVQSQGDNQGDRLPEIPGMSKRRLVKIEQDILGKNNAIAEQNQDYFDKLGVKAFNLMSSPGSGKTTLLEQTLLAFKQRGQRIPVVIEGDQQTSNDADRIEAVGGKTLQINTGKGCHLDANMISKALTELSLEENSTLFIENVGNLVCPSAFDLGEHTKVALLSVTEGDDKPLKYPDMFAIADLMLINKIDLLPYVDFDVERCIEFAKSVNPDIEVICLSAKSKQGFDRWLDCFTAAKLPVTE